MADTEPVQPATSPDAGPGPVSLNLFAAFYRAEHPERLQASFAEHLRWATEQEAAGRIFLTGPLMPLEKGDGLSGLTLFRAGSLDEADALARTDPFITDGVNSVEMQPWRVAGGSFNFAMRLSNSSIVIR